jgi:EAL domain-containing protein (putative c-di-GMP-specific phosphodiesterase class I)
MVFSSQVALALRLQPEHQNLVQRSSGVLLALLLAGLLYWQLKRAERSLARSALAAARGMPTHADAGLSRIAPRSDRSGLAAGGATLSARLQQRADPDRVPRTSPPGLPPAVAAAVSRRVAVEAGLLLANLDEEFTLQLQPRWCVTTRQTLGAEALLRWKCPGLGAVSPDEFIPIAEQHPVICRLGRWIVVQVAQTLASCIHRHPALQVSINLSACQLQDKGFPRFVADTVAQAGLAASCIQFELTETRMVGNLEAARSFLEALRGEGFTVALDDFGAGYSSLSYLAHFPVDVIKLDRSFIADLPHDPAACIVASGIIGMARRLGIRTVGEGVETEAQRQFLEGAGCREAQGWLVSRALPIDDFLRRLEGHAACALA